MTETSERTVPMDIPAPTHAVGIFDPVSASSFTVIRLEDGVTFAFKKSVYMPVGLELLTQVIAPAATVSISWSNAKDLIRILAEVIEAHEAQHGEVPLPGATVV